MEPNPYNEVGKNPQSTFYGALSGSVCFPMPLMYNPINSYPFMSTPFLPMHHPMLSSHGLQDSHMLPNGETMQLSKSSDDINSRALAYLQSRYQSMSKCYLPPSRKTMPSKFCSSILDVQTENDNSKLSTGYGVPHKSDSLIDVTASGSYGDKECYLSSPSTEVEEPDSSGKCSTDVTEQKIIPRWTCDSSQPPICPICGRTISLQDLTDHYHMELDKLNELMRKKEWLMGEDTNPEQINSQRFQSYHDVEKRCPEFRKETYLRVRANRINRLGGCGPRTKRQCFEESKNPWKMQRMSQLVSPKQENAAEETTAQQSMLMLELTVQQLAHQAERRPEIETKARNVYHEQQETESYHEDQSKSGLADSSCNNLDVGSCPMPGYGESKLEHIENDNPCSTVEMKCQVCLESYKKPVVSTNCWHVHCEVCWLKALGSKRVCPQCEAITSPENLRRIHL